MVRLRLCARPGCGQPAAGTLTFQYATRTIALDDLREPEPCTIDLCERHADRLTAPKGWTGHDRRAKTLSLAPPPAPHDLLGSSVPADSATDPDERSLFRAS